MATRGKGDGSIFEYRGKWAGTVEVGRPGARKKRWVYGKSKTEVKAKIKAIRAKLEAGVYVEPSKLTVSAWIDEWLSIVEANLRANTLRSYQGVIDNHIKAHLGHRRVQELEERDLDHLFRDMRKAGAGARTVELAYAVLCQSLKFAAKRRIIGRSLCEDVDKPRYEPGEMSYYRPDEVRRILEAAETVLEQAVFQTLLGAGVRGGELLGLEIGDLEKGALTISRQLQVVAGGDPPWRYTPPKSARGVRRIDIPSSVEAALRALRAEQMKASEEAFEKGNAELAKALAGPLLFKGARGAPWRWSNLSRRIYTPVLKRAGVPRYNPHALRHTHAALCISQGMHVDPLSRRMGHGDAATTLRLYGHMFEGLQREAIDRLEDLFKIGGAS